MLKLIPKILKVANTSPGRKNTEQSRKGNKKRKQRNEYPCPLQKKTQIYLRKQNQNQTQKIQAGQSENTFCQDNLNNKQKKGQCFYPRIQRLQ
jgi:hypothetical protein